MWTNPEEARSDFVLAAAAALFGPLVLSFLLPLLPLRGLGILSVFVQAALVFAVTGLVPLLLARYRDEGITAFGLDTPRDGLPIGLLVASPIVVVDVARRLIEGRDLLPGLIGNLARVPLAPLDAFATIAALGISIVGTILLYTFLTAKARFAFARNELPLLEVLRTFGMGAAAAGLVVGVIVSLTGEVTFLRAVLDAVVLGVIVLLADRYVAPQQTTTRATVLAPAIVAAVIGLNLFGGGFLPTLRQGVLAGGYVLVAAVMLETRRYAWATITMFAVTGLWVTALAP